jgi:predicted  nucleic acid-binding Zn-ribbon protein
MKTYTEKEAKHSKEIRELKSRIKQLEDDRSSLIRQYLELQDKSKELEAENKQLCAIIEPIAGNTLKEKQYSLLGLARLAHGNK